MKSLAHAIKKILSKPPQVDFISNVHTLLPIVLGFILIPHLGNAPIVITFYVVAILLWFTLHTLGVTPLPGKLIRFIMILLSLFLLAISYGTVFSQKASLSLLAIMVSLKLLEVQNEQDRRNIFLVLFLGYFILISHFLHSQDILLGLFALVNTVILTLMLSAFNRKPQTALALKKNLYLIARLFVKALPIAILLFLFFPRIPGPLWSLPNEGQSGRTGLSDKMYPGSVTQLVDSNEIAFRIDFAKSIPTADKLYWRGPVLSKTDGFLWSTRKQKKLSLPFSQVVKKEKENKNNTFSYTITLEPHAQKWLFALEMPFKIQGDTINGFYFNNDLQLLNKSNIHQLTQYHATSMTQFVLNTVTANELQLSLEFPIRSNPKTYQLGQQWQATFNEPQQIVLAALNHFKDNPFYYTKQPDSMTANPSDQFLFDTQRGFCEHYASSFVLLMRAANIPARVITGYQGIEKNNIGNYYLVRQSNAHAWAEVWIEDKGWLRVDPTAMIPANRIEPDIFQTNLERLSFSSLNLPDLSKLSAQQKTALYRFYQQIQQSIDNIKHSWNNWILGYDKTKQGLLLTLLGLSANWQNLIFLLIGGLLLIACVFQLISLYQRYQKRDKIYYYYVSFIKKLNKSGLPVTLSDGPEAIKKQACKQFPQQCVLIKFIISHYIQIRYAGKNNEILSKRFISEVKQYSSHKVKSR